MAKRPGPPTSKRLVVPRLDESGRVVYEEAHGPIKPSHSVDALEELDDADWPIPTPEQAQQLQEWYDGWPWISKAAAIEWIQNRYGVPILKARKYLGDARASREVSYLSNRVDGVFPVDGVADPNPRYDYMFRQDELVAWLDGHMSRKDPAPAAAVPAPAVVPEPISPPSYEPAPTKKQRVAIIAKGLWSTGRPPDTLTPKEAVQALHKHCKTHGISLEFVKESTIWRALGCKDRGRKK